ncbi:hypothetical protein WR25_08435 [Diploscapter pachys]|uniref:Uncharacterized protein n=1 Tax=Diploscapter pachys TaxID=2018661 RepID=A0A2A2KCZ2_9BILA|nr:hypothetical protein WR25_08435 [Diploscapter pachys]
MAMDSARHLDGGKSAVALHACGDLHVRLLQLASEQGCRQIARQQRDVDEYLPTPSLPVSWLAKPFEHYCRDLAELKQLTINGQPDWVALEAAGQQRLAEVRNLEQVRNLFRRPLEMWLVLDRALFLQEQGYSVRLGVFCDYPLTPRNLLLLGERDATPQRG